MTIEEALAASEAEPVTDDDMQFWIDEHLRVISIPKNGVVAGVEGDKNVNKIKFGMNRYYHGFDMSELSGRILYSNAKGNKNYYNITDMQTNGNTITFSWLVDADAVQYMGKTAFVVYLFKIQGSELRQKFYSTLATLKVLEGMEVDSAVPVEKQTDIIERMKEEISAYAEEVKKSLPADYTAMTEQVSSLKEDIDKLDESVKKKVEPNRTTFFDYTEEIHESVNLFNVQNTVVNSDGLTITIKDGNIKCEGVYNLSYNKPIDTGSTIALSKGEYDVSAWNGSGEFDVDLVSGSETKRVNCNGATHTTIKLAADTTYSIKVRCTPSFSSGSCDLMIVKGLSKPLAYEKWFETYSTFSDASVQKAVLPMYQKFYGKRIVTIGDSIMHGDGNDYYGIGDILAERNGMKLSDYSEGGATISFRQDKASASDEWSKGQNIQYQATKMLANETEKPCVVLIDGQTNDINYVSGSEEPQQALGTVTTSYTSFSSNENFCGGLEKIFSDIKKVWTDVPIIYIRVHKMMSRKAEWQESYGEKAIQICKKWSVKVVDIYGEGGLNTLIKEHKIYTGNNGDYTHPNREGYDKFYIPMIENAMMQLIN